MRPLTHAFLLALAPVVAASAHAELVTATLDARTGDVLECTVINAADTNEEVFLQIVDALGGAVLAGDVFNLPPGEVGSLSFAVPFTGPKQAYCEVDAGGPDQAFRASLKRLTGPREVEDSSDATSPGGAVTTAHQYVPYSVTFSQGLDGDGFVCAEVDAGFQSDRLIIDSDAPFTVTTLLVIVQGFDDAADQFSFSNLRVDGQLSSVRSPNLVEAAGPPFNVPPFDVLGGSFPGADRFINAPLELSSNGDPNEASDIQLVFECNAGTTGDDADITFVQVQGWRRADSPVSVVLQD